MPRPKRVIGDSILTAALAGLEAQKQRIEQQMAQVRSLLGKRRGEALAPAPARPGRKRRLSAAARQRISDAQKRRWESYRKQRAAEAKS